MVRVALGGAVLVGLLSVLYVRGARAQTTPTPGPTTIADLSCSSGSASRYDRKVMCSNILYINEATTYRSYGNTIFNILKAYVDARLSAEAVCLGAHGATKVIGISNLPTDLSAYTQIWVYDLDHGVASHADKWQSIAAWFEAGYPQQRQEIILDGRILSSAFGQGTFGANHWQIFYNYFENLRDRGGGLLLGTDHGGSEGQPCGAFTCGINTVSEALNIGKFWGSYSGPGVAYVDVGSPLISFPLDASESAAARWKSAYTCVNSARCVVGTVFDRIVWDHTTTSQPAIGLQPNGMTFYAVAFHSQQTAFPAISSTIRGTLNFQVKILEPSCDQCYVAGESATIVVAVQVVSVGPYHGWTAQHLGGRANAIPSATAFTVAADGLSATMTTLPLDEGDHGFAVQVTDSQGSVASATVRVSVRRSCVCENPVDLLFILDESESVGVENYGKTMDLLQNVVTRFRVGTGANDGQIALVKFATLSTLSFDLDDHHSNSAVTNAMGATQYSSSGTTRCPGYSMKIASDQAICRSCPGRSPRSAPITVVFLTNGNPSLIGLCDGGNGNQGMDRIAEVVRLKGLVERIIPVGIGSGVSGAYLEGLAKDMPVQSNGNSYLSAEYVNLAAITGAITDAACPISPPSFAPSDAPTTEPSHGPTVHPTTAPTFDCTGCTDEQKQECDMGAGRPGTCGFTTALCDVTFCGCGGIGFMCSGVNCTLCTVAPTRAPTSFPTAAPSTAPSFRPTIAPSVPTKAPTYWNLFASGEESKSEEAGTIPVAAAAGLGALAIIAIVLGVVAAVIISLMVMGGVGIFALKHTLFEVHGTVEAKEIAMQSRRTGGTVVAKALTPEQVAAMGLVDVSGAGRETYNPLDAVNIEQSI